MQLELGRAVQRAVVAGVAAVLGGLSAPFEDLVVRRRSVLRHDWLWAVGHHPFGPLSNTPSLSLLLQDIMLVKGSSLAQKSPLPCPLGHLFFLSLALCRTADSFAASWQ